MSAKFSVRRPLAQVSQRHRWVWGVSTALLLLLAVGALAGLGLQASGGALGVAAVAGLLAAAVVAGATLGLMLSRGRSGTPAADADLAERMAEGDLSTEIDTTGEAELVRLQGAVAQMQDRLRQMVGSIHEASEAMQAPGTPSAEPLRSQAQPAAGRSPASYLSLSPDELVASAVAAAQRGGEVVSQVAANMEEISSSSRKIGEIISVIDGIAFQTNLLALNAAVKAAHAGQAGASFKVVAGEVRNLAQRAANAAKEIKSLIHASVEKVETGGQLVKDAGATMESIVSSVQSVTELLGQISTQASDAGEGLQQVRVCVSKLDEMTERNAVLVGASASAAEALRSQAERLQKVVGAFRLLQQTQEAAWTAHTAISSARDRSKSGHNPAGSGEAVWGHERRTPPPSTDNTGKGDWESF